MRWSPVIWIHDRYISKSFVEHTLKEGRGRNWFKFRDTVRLILETWLAMSKDIPIADEYSQMQQSLQKQGQEVPLPGVHMITDKPDVTGTQWEGNVRAFAESLHSEIARGLGSLSVHLVDEDDCLKAMRMELGRDGRCHDHKMRHPRFLKSSFFTLTFEPGFDVILSDSNHIATGTFVTLADEPARLVAKVMRLAANNCRTRWPDTSSSAAGMPMEHKSLGKLIEDMFSV
jgi:hypothetical protein